MSKFNKLVDPDTLVVLTFAKAGLGHLRVAYALMEGLPSEARSVLFSSTDNATTFLHRLTSTNPVMRELGEAMQYGVLEDAFTSIYTRTLRRRASKLLPQLASFSESKPTPKRIVFVATHFGLAHQIGQIKAELERASARGRPVSGWQGEAKLVVVVTDDSPQHPWLVPNADLTIVPSKTTKSRLLAYARNKKLKPYIEAVHYPLSLELGSQLKKSKFELRQKQADPLSTVEAKVSLPVSGAAVGLDFFNKLTLRLNELNGRYHFYLVSRETDYTKPFLAQMASRPYVSVVSSIFDRSVVSNYNKIIQENVLSFEVTKPSEQAFKALYTPKQAGGVILLLSSPVGRQELDNLWYLERNNLIPKKADQESLWKHAMDGKPIEKGLLARAKNWRGVRLLKNQHKSALFIEWCLKENVFSEMMRFNKKDKSSGVEDIWSMVDAVV